MANKPSNWTTWVTYMNIVELQESCYKMLFFLWLYKHKRPKEHFTARWLFFLTWSHITHMINTFKAILTNPSDLILRELIWLMPSVNQLVQFHHEWSLSADREQTLPQRTEKAARLVDLQGALWALKFVNTGTREDDKSQYLW